jgi:putative hydrolase of the HAD superfamily
LNKKATGKLPKAKKRNVTSTKAVLFDLDETLIDSIQGHTGAHATVCRILTQFLARKKVMINERELLSKISTLDDEMNKKFIYDRDVWWPRLIKAIVPNVSLPRSLVKRLTRAYWLAYASDAKPYSDTVSTLNYLKKKGYLLGLLSDTDHLPGMKRYRIEIQPFKYLFNLTLVSGEETKETKPSPEPFLVAADRLGVKPEECIFVGDKPFADVKGAKKARMKTVLIYRREWGSAIKPDYTIKSLSELTNILRKIS